MRKIIFGLLHYAGLPIVVGIAAILAMLIAPQPLFAYHTTHGDLELWSDQPFTEAAGQRLLRQVKYRLNQSQLYRRGQTHRIFVVNSAWRRRLLFLHHYGAGGLNYYPITRNVFIRQSDIDSGRVLHHSGEPVAEPRTLAYYAAHEIGHSLTGEEAGTLRFMQMPVWVREGIADYIALPEAGDLDGLLAAHKAGERSMDPAKSGLYMLYRLLVTMALEKHGWSMEQLLASRLSRQEAEAVLLAAD